ncbi:MAG: hypothetical protein MPK62_01350 [Alphaproteobacteria bacterium]|nr:hypothetical protein [Alphaproteobacteria bacterium]MDA8029781.1 hypothetical protein [Alphaproteobacteria bacterium]
MKSISPPPGARHTFIRKFKGIVYDSGRGVRWNKDLYSDAEYALGGAVDDEPGRWNSPYIRLVLKDRVRKARSDSAFISVEVDILDKGGMWKDAGFLFIHGWDEA